MSIDQGIKQRELPQPLTGPELKESVEAMKFRMTKGCAGGLKDAIMRACLLHRAQPKQI